MNIDIAIDDNAKDKNNKMVIKLNASRRKATEDGARINRLSA
jgi:hypothetical protein